MSLSGRRAELIEELEALIDEATRQGQEKLPPERDLAEIMGVPRSTLRRAMDELEARNRIFRVMGRSGGAFVTAVAESDPIPALRFDANASRLVRDLNTIKGIPQMLVEQGFRAGTRVVSETVEPAPESIAAALGLVEGAPVISLLRLRLADDEPLSLERMYLDHARFPDLLQYSPILSLYSTLNEHYGVSMASADELIEIGTANRQVASLLGIRPWSPVLSLRRVGRGAAGDAVEASVDLFRGDRIRLAVHTTLDA